MIIAICDDDEVVRKDVQKHIAEYANKHHLKLPEIYLFASGEELIASEKIYDMAFLDVEMKGISGIHAGRYLAQRNKKILIFIITAHEDYLDEALHFHAFRFLTKPLDKYRFFRNFTDALQAYNTSVEKIAIETKDGVYTVNTSDIIMIEATIKKVYIITTDYTYTSLQNLHYWINKLNSICFFQTHRSFIVNMEHIDNFSHNTVSLFHGKCTAYLTVRKYPEFKKAYLMYLECMQ